MLTHQSASTSTRKPLKRASYWLLLALAAVLATGLSSCASLGNAPEPPGPQPGYGEFSSVEAPSSEWHFFSARGERGRAVVAWA